MPPSLVTAPATDLVSLREVKAHLRVDFSDDDALLGLLIDAAVAHLDGWKGILGRGLMPQTWAEEFDAWGSWRLSLPDVDADSVAITAEDASGDPVAATSSTILRDHAGTVVTAAGPAATLITVTYDVALPAEQLAAAKVGALMLIAHWYNNREAVGQGGLEDLPLTARALLTPLRWNLM